MGRYSTQLAAQMADLAGIEAGQRVLDVGCGPGALTTELVARVGAESVAAVDPSEQFVAAARERHRGVDVRQSAAEELPFPDATFDAALAQLVVHFMADPVCGLGEMARGTRVGGARCRVARRPRLPLLLLAGPDLAAPRAAFQAAALDQLLEALEIAAHPPLVEPGGRAEGFGRPFRLVAHRQADERLRVAARLERHG